MSSTEGDAGEDDAREGGSSKTTEEHELNKSCDRCGFKKRKCDGENPCRRCIRLGATCSYSHRRPRVTRPKPPPTEPVPTGSASDNDNVGDKPATPRARRGVSAALRPYGRVSLKRCRLSPSPATGLVGMQENMFLSDYFGCVGFLPFTSQSHIRETLVKMFSGSVAMNYPASGDSSTTEEPFDSIMPQRLDHAAGGSASCGSLHLRLLVEKYSRLARDALANVSGPANGEVARAWAILAYMSDFCGDHDNFHVYLQTANAVLSDIQEQGHQTLPEGLLDVVKHGETIKLFVGEFESTEVESFCDQEHSNPQMNEAATEGDLCQFVMRSYRSFEQAVYQNVVDHRSTSCGPRGDRELSGDIASADPVGEDLLSGSRPHYLASLIREGAGSHSSGILDMMTMMTRQHSRQFQQIEHAADREDIRGGIGGLIISGTLVFEKIAKKDIAGALENLETCGRVVQQYPGVCRFTMWSHITHMLMGYLAVIDGPRAQAIYEQMREAYNSALRPGTQAIPPFEEWQGVSAYCDNYNCRLIERMVNIEHDGVSSCSPPQERFVEVQEKELRNAPVHGQGQRGGASPIDFREGAEGISAVHAQGRDTTEDGSISYRKPERVSGKESAGCMESLWTDGRPAALAQPQEPTCTTSLLRTVGSDPLVDSDVCRFEDDQSNPGSTPELEAHAAGELLLYELSTGRSTTEGEPDDESIGVEYWLDVTHTMLDTNTSGLEIDLM